MSAATHTSGATPHYFIPQPSRHPVLVATAMLLIIFGYFTPNIWYCARLASLNEASMIHAPL